MTTNDTPQTGHAAAHNGYSVDLATLAATRVALEPSLAYRPMDADIRTGLGAGWTTLWTTDRLAVVDWPALVWVDTTAPIYIAGQWAPGNLDADKPAQCRARLMLEYQDELTGDWGKPPTIPGTSTDAVTSTVHDYLTSRPPYDGVTGQVSLYTQVPCSFTELVVVDAGAAWWQLRLRGSVDHIYDPAAEVHSDDVRWPYLHSQLAVVGLSGFALNVVEA